MRFFLLLMLFCLPAPLLAAERVCQGTAVTVRADNLSEADRICLGANNVLPFLRQFGLDAAISIVVEVTDALPPGHLAGELGSFDTRDNLVRIRTYAAFSTMARSGTVFRIPPDEALHVSYVTHELVHAYTHAGMQRRRIGWVAQEYMAYAAQLASMPEPLRERILSRYEQKGFADASEIGETYLLLDPHAFAVKAYRHYSLPGNGPAFVRRLLDGSLRLGENSR
jgi:hypothetical protein